MRRVRGRCQVPGEAYIRRVRRCQAAVPTEGERKTAPGGAQKSEVQKKRCRNANDHEQQARVHPALPTIPWSSRRRSLFKSINVAVKNHIGTVRTFRKGSSMIRKSMPQIAPWGYDPMGGYRFSEKIMLK